MGRNNAFSVKKKAFCIELETIFYEALITTKFLGLEFEIEKSDQTTYKKGTSIRQIIVL